MRNGALIAVFWILLQHCAARACMQFTVIWLHQSGFIGAEKEIRGYGRNIELLFELGSNQ